MGQVRSDDGNSDNRANSNQLELELGLSLAIRKFGRKKQVITITPGIKNPHHLTNAYIPFTSSDKMADD